MSIAFEASVLPEALASARAVALATGLPYAGGVLPQVAWQLFSREQVALVDVRSAEERKFVGHVPGSLHVPWATGTALTRNPRFVRELEAKVGKHTPALLLCRSGKRSALAAEAAAKAGLGLVFNVLEGFEGEINASGHRGTQDGWRFRGLPWVQDDVSAVPDNPNASRQPLFDVGRVVAELAKVRLQWRAQQQRSTEPGGRELPSRAALEAIVTDLCGVLFPMRLGPPDLRLETEDFYVGHTLDSALHALVAQVRLELGYASRRQAEPSPAKLDDEAVALVRSFSRALPGIRTSLDADVLAAFQGDPAARSVDEVLLCYPGVLAVIYHRIAHKLHTLGVPCWHASWQSWRMA